VTLKIRINSLEHHYYCPVCFTPIDQNNGEKHDACNVFSGLEYHDTRTRLSRKKLEEYNGDWQKLFTIAVYNLLIPWDLQKSELNSWFNTIETLVLAIEKDEVPHSNIVNALLAIEEDLFCIKRIADDTVYSLQDFFTSWNPKKPLSSVEYFTRYLQRGRENLNIQWIKSSKTILKTLYKNILNTNPDHLITYPVNWFDISKINRRIFYQKTKKQIISMRSINDRPILSSTYNLKGRWLGWSIKKDTIEDIPQLPEFLPEDIVLKEHITTTWNRLASKKSDIENIKSIIHAHGMEIHGNPHPDLSDDGALRSNAEITSPGILTIFEQLTRITDCSNKPHIKFQPASNTLNFKKLEEKGINFIQENTKFKKSRNEIQAQSIGFVINNKNFLLSIIMPTGTGKSLIPLCAAINTLSDQNKNPSIVIVVCPLIALLEDQVITARSDSEHPKFLDKNNTTICRLHHILENKEHNNVISAIRNNKCVLLFLTAEQLQRETTLQALSNRNIDWLFIDEAHGVLEFEGYRPAYARMWYSIQRLKQISQDMGVAIQSATLPVHFENRVWKKLLRTDNFPNPVSMRSNEIRSNLNFNTVKKFNPTEKQERNHQSVKQVVNAVKNNKRTILYTLYLTHENYFKSMYKELQKELQGYTIGYFCGKDCKINDQTISKNDFISEFSNGEIDAILATMAFGLGINRNDVECIVFNGVPSSLNTLYQQAGRAARGIKSDGKYIYQGDIQIFFQEEEDFHHQDTLSSQQRLYATTACRLFECMRMSEKSQELAEGLYLLDYTVDSNSKIDPGPSQIDRINNLNSLRILSEIGAIEWIGNIPSQIRIPKDAIKTIFNRDPDDFLSDINHDKIQGEIIKVESGEFLKKGIATINTSLSQCYQIIQDISLACYNSPITWDFDKQNLAFIAWLWDKDKKSLEKSISKWRIDDLGNYFKEEDYVREFVSKNTHKERIDIITKYFGFKDNKR
jgi:superfamily II DNA helicase RecQ